MGKRTRIAALGGGKEPPSRLAAHERRDLRAPCKTEYRTEGSGFYMQALLSNEIRRRAELLACEIEFGLARVDDAVDWADARIAAMERPNDLLIDLSTGALRHPADVVRDLRAISGIPGPTLDRDSHHSYAPTKLIRRATWNLQHC